MTSIAATSAAKVPPRTRTASGAAELPPPPPSYGAAAIATAIVFGLYLLTLAPTTALWDASEYIAAAHVLGIPHPPGNPFFILLGRVFSILPIGPTVAVRINILAALCSALSAGVWFLIAERVLAMWLPTRWQRLTGAAIVTVIGATAFTVWNQSVVNEKVYTVSLLFFAIVSWLTVLWCDEPDGPTADRILVLIAFLIGLGYSNHPAGFLVAPAVGVAVLARRARTIVRWKLILACVGALTLGLTPFAVQPIRAAHFPALNEGEPTACTTEIGVGCTFSGETWKRLKANIDREQYGKPSLLTRQAPFGAQLGMWWLYFKWQWLRDAHLENQGTQRMLAFLFLGLGLLGGWMHWQKDRRSFSFFGPLIFTVTLALVFYMNFKYGASQAPELEGSVAREVRDRDYFYLWSFSAWSVWAGLGLVAVWAAVARLVTATKDDDDARIPQRGWLAGIPVLAFAFVPLVGNWNQASRATETIAREFAHDLLNSVEPYGILVTVGDNDTFPLWYAQEVEGIRKDVTVANTSLLGTDWYARQLIRREIFAYDAAKGPAVYRGREWAKPQQPVLRMTIAESDQVPQYVEVPGPQVFREGQVEAVVDPRRLEYGVLTRADLFVLRMIKDNYAGPRSIYFARTSGSYGESLGLGRYLLTQGLAQKVATAPLQASRDTVPAEGAGFLDVGRSHDLMMKVFRGPEAIIRRGDWVDRPSVGLAASYTISGLLLADALAMRGDTAAANRMNQRAMAVAQATRTTEWFGPRMQQQAPPIPLSPGGDAPAGTPVPGSGGTR